MSENFLIQRSSPWCGIIINFNMSGNLNFVFLLGLLSFTFICTHGQNSTTEQSKTIPSTLYTQQHNQNDTTLLAESALKADEILLGWI